MQQARTVTATFASNSGLIAIFTNALLGLGQPTAAESSVLDALGNANGIPDVGDLVALLDRTPGATLAPEILFRLLGGQPDVKKPQQ
jgi:hypothetical protein